MCRGPRTDLDPQDHARLGNCASLLRCVRVAKTWRKGLVPMDLGGWRHVTERYDHPRSAGTKPSDSRRAADRMLERPPAYESSAPSPKQVLHRHSERPALGVQNLLCGSVDSNRESLRYGLVRPADATHQEAARWIARPLSCEHDCD